MMVKLTKKKKLANPIQIKFRGQLLDPKKAITEFNWDEGKYPNRSKSIGDIMHKINEIRAIKKPVLRTCTRLVKK